MTIYLTEDDVRDVIDMEMSIAVIEKAFQALADGQAENVPRRRAKAPGIMLHTMSAAAEYLGLVGWKAYTTTREGAKFHVGLYRADTGELIALIEANYLGQLRTGAASGVATEFMARPDSRIVGLLGSGLQARTQLKAVCTVRQIERVDVYSRNAERCEQFAEEMTEYCRTEVVPVHGPDQAAAEKDILICATNSKVPLFDGRVLELGTHLNVMGSNHLGKAEIDVATVQLADHIVCDSVEACKIEAGDFVEALDQGVTDWRRMHDLADVVAGRQTGRATPDDVTLFKSVGLAVEDVALAATILEARESRGPGQTTAVLIGHSGSARPKSLVETLDRSRPVCEGKGRGGAFRFFYQTPIDRFSSSLGQGRKLHHTNPIQPNLLERGGESAMPAWPGGPCPQCGEFMPENLIHCQTCRALLNEELETDSVEVPAFIPLEEINSMVELRPKGFYVLCPHCSEELRVNSKYAGLRVGCKFCHAQYELDLGSPKLTLKAYYADCPECGEELRVSQKYLGQKVACKHCHARLHFVPS